MRSTAMLLVGALCAGCSVECGAEGLPFVGDLGPQTTQERDVDDFSAVEATGSIDVRITHGSETKVEVEAPEKELGHIVTEVDGDTLTIKKRSMTGVHLSRGSTIVRVTTPTLSRASTAGSGDLEIIGLQDLEEASARGSGNLAITGLEGDAFELRSSGSGDTNIAGTAESFELETTGSGDVEAGTFEVKRVTITTKGSGDVLLHATERVEGSSVGSGDVDVKGSASCEIRSRGSGTVRCSGVTANPG